MPSAHVTALASTSSGLFVGFFDAGVWRKTADGFEPVRGAPRFVNQLVAARGRLYAASAKGLHELTAPGVMRRVPLDVTSEHINGLHVGADGQLWIATSHGLVNVSSGRTRVFALAQGLPSRIVYAVTETNDGAIWAGTAEGLARIYAGRIATFTHASGALPADWVTSLVPDGGRVIAGTYDAGVVVVNARGESEPAPAFARAWINPHGLARIDAQLVAATLGDGLIVQSGRRGVAIANLPATDVTCAVSHAGHVWVGTRGGLARLDKLAP